MPVSTIATRIPCPRTPKLAHTWSAPMKGTLVLRSIWTIDTGCTDRTSARWASVAAAFAESRAENAFTRTL